MTPTDTSNIQRLIVSVDAGGTISVMPDPVNVAGPDALLAFRLVGADWVFPDEGAIVVHAGGSAFPYPSWTVNPQLAVLVDLDPSPAEFHYTVSVVHSTTRQRVSIDPTIKNEG
jgi:hypothetical protein